MTAGMGAGAAARNPFEKAPSNNSYWPPREEGGETQMAVSTDLGDVLESFVIKLVASGRYHSKSEVLREGVRLVWEREARLAALDASIARGLTYADAGRVKPSSEAFERLE